MRCRVLNDVPQVRQKLQTLVDVGLGYVHLGQSATTLSGGEAQRMKLARELSKRQTGRTLYLLDEPTTGLHFDDVRKLLEVLHRLSRPGQLGDHHRAQPGRDPQCRLGDGPGPGGRRRRRPRGRRGAAGADRGDASAPTPASSSSATTLQRTAQLVETEFGGFGHRGDAATSSRGRKNGIAGRPARKTSASGN